MTSNKRGSWQYANVCQQKQTSNYAQNNDFSQLGTQLGKG